MLTESYLEPSRTSTMELFPLWLNHILKTYLIRLNFLHSIFYTTHSFVKKLTTVKISGEKVFFNNRTIFFLKFEIMQWNGVIDKQGFLN